MATRSERLQRIDASTYIGSGKALEIADLAKQNDTEDDVISTQRRPAAPERRKNRGRS